MKDVKRDFDRVAIEQVMAFLRLDKNDGRWLFDAKSSVEEGFVGSARHVLDRIDAIVGRMAGIASKVGPLKI